MSYVGEERRSKGTFDDANELRESGISRIQYEEGGKDDPELEAVM